MKNVALSVWISRSVRLSRLVAAYEATTCQARRGRLAVMIAEVSAKV